MNTELRTLTESEIDFVAGGALSGALGVGVGVGSAKTHTSTFTKASSGFFGSSAKSGATADASGTLGAGALSVSFASA